MDVKDVLLSVYCALRSGEYIWPVFITETEDWSVFNVSMYVRSWCDGSSDQSFRVDPLRYCSFRKK